jgi:DNA polymerase-3 subunit alpha
MADNSDFTHLHAHGEYSMLDGVGTIEHVVPIAKKIGFRALAQTDHGNVSGCLKFAKECKKNEIKPIVGCELYLTDDVDYRKAKDVKADREDLYHTIALAKDWTGFQSLMALLTKAHSKQGFYYKPRVGWADLYQLKNCVVTSACIGGPFKHVNWKTKISEYREAFGEDFYIEIQPHNIPEQYDLNRRALEMSLHTGAKLVASNDFHYAQSEDCHAQEALLGIRNKQTVTSDDKWDFTPGLYMRTYQEMLDSFAVLQAGQGGSNVTGELAAWALQNTAEIVEKCEFKIPKFEVGLPDVDTSELGTSDPDVALVELCIRGWKRRFPDVELVSPAGKPYFDRFQKEVGIIQKLNFSKYFLLVWDIYRFCNRKGIFYGPGRGSGAGSLVCYLLGITNADPLEYGLIFERFINPERIDPT